MENMEKREHERELKKGKLTDLLSEAGFETDDINEEDSLWDVFQKIGAGKIIVCDDVRTFDSDNMEKMKKQGRVLCEFDLKENSSTGD